MAKLKRNCEKCSNAVGTWCTMQKDMEKASKRLSQQTLTHNTGKVNNG